MVNAPMRASAAERRAWEAADELTRLERDEATVAKHNTILRYASGVYAAYKAGSLLYKAAVCCVNPGAAAALTLGECVESVTAAVVHAFSFTTTAQSSPKKRELTIGALIVPILLRTNEIPMDPLECFAKT